MKKSMIASLIMGAGAVFAASGVAGCSAETGAPGEQIGSASAAITASNISGVLATAAPHAHAYGQSCMITASGSTYLMVVGGKDNSSVHPTNRVDLFDGTNWTAVTTNALVAVERGAMIADPASAARCVLFGGEDNGTKTDTIVSLTLTVSMGTPSVAVAQAGKLNSARSYLKVIPCKGDILAIAGKDSGGASKLLDHWTTAALGTTTAVAPLKNTNASPAEVQLNLSRRDFAADVDSTGALVGGGFNTSGTAISDVEAIRFTASCQLDDSSVASPSIANPTDLSAGTASAKLGNTGTANPRGALAAYYDGTVFQFVAGRTGGGTPTAKASVDKFTVTWNTAPTAPTATGAAGTALQTAVANPTFVKVSAADVLLFGGNDATNSIADVQEATPTTTTTTTDKNGAALTILEGSFAGYFSGTGKGFYGGGFKSGTTYPLDVRQVF